MKRLSWKYIAGLIDGEGCLDVQHTYNKNYPDSAYIRPRLRVTMSANAHFVLDMLHQNLGGGLSKRPRKFDNPNWQDAYEWSIEGKRARPVLQNIVNHLYIKKEQAKLLIWMIDNLMGKHAPVSVREHLKEELKAMKRDPHRLSEVAVAKAEVMMADVAEDEVRSSVKQCLGCGKHMRRHAKT
jgi:hypothetical protein